MVPAGKSIAEQLQEKGIEPLDIDRILLSHLDCDHANGLKDVASAKSIAVSEEELRFATNGSMVNKMVQSRLVDKYQDSTVLLKQDGPATKSWDVLEDGSLVMISIPGQSDG